MKQLPALGPMCATPAYEVVQHWRLPLSAQPLRALHAIPSLLQPPLSQTKTELASVPLLVLQTAQAALLSLPTGPTSRAKSPALPRYVRMCCPIWPHCSLDQLTTSGSALLWPLFVGSSQSRGLNSCLANLTTRCATEVGEPGKARRYAAHLVRALDFFCLCGMQWNRTDEPGIHSPPPPLRGGAAPVDHLRHMTMHTLETSPCACAHTGVAFTEGCTSRPDECWVVENWNVKTCIRDDRKCLQGR